MFSNIIFTLLSFFFFTSHLTSYEFTISCMFRDEAPYLKEWVEYHKMIGTEHFWLYDNLSEDNWEEVLAPYIEEGLVEVIPWPAWDEELRRSGRPTSLAIRDRIQPLAMKDALKRANGVAKWIAFIDADEFFLPKKEKTITECLEKHYFDADGVFVSWRNFGTNNMYIPKGESILCKLTTCARKEHAKNSNGKSILRPDKVDIDNVFWVHTANLNSSGRFLDGSGNDAISDPNKARFRWQVHEDHICLNHYFCRDENFFQERRVKLRNENAYSLQTLNVYRKEFAAEENLLMKNFIMQKHLDMYEKFWKE